MIIVIKWWVYVGVYGDEIINDDINNCMIVNKRYNIWW